MNCEEMVFYQVHNFKLHVLWCIMRPHYKPKYNWQSNQPDWYFCICYFITPAYQANLLCHTFVFMMSLRPCRYWSWHVTSCLHYKLLTSQSWMKWSFIATNLYRNSCAQSGAPWVRKCGKLPIRENWVITWPYTGWPSIHTTGIPMWNNSFHRYGNPNVTQGYFDGKSHSHPRFVKRRQLKSQ